MAKLNAKQQAFIQEYLKDFNATKAAIRAGYSEQTAYSQGQRLLKNVEVNKKIEEEMGKLRERMAKDSNKAYALLWKQLDEVEELLRKHEQAKTELNRLSKYKAEAERRLAKIDEEDKETRASISKEIACLIADIKACYVDILKEHNWIRAQELRASLLQDILDRGGYKATDKVELSGKVELNPIQAIIVAARRRVEGHE